MPVLDRQAGHPTTTLPPSLQGLPPRSVPEVAPTPLQKHYINLSVPVLIAGLIAITALNLGARLGDPLIKLCVLIAAPLLVITTSDAIVRIWRSAWAWMPVDRGKGLFRLAWVAVSVVGLARARRSRASSCCSPDGRGRLRPRAGRPLDGSRLRQGRPDVDRAVPELLLELRHCAEPRRHRRRGPRPSVVRRLRPHRLRQSATRGHDAPDHRRRPSWSCCAGASSRAAAHGRSRAASSRSTRRSTRQRSARRSEETGLVVEPGEIIGLYTRLEAAVVTIAFEARVVGGDRDADPRGARDRHVRPGGDPVAGARVPDDDVDAARLA